MHEVAEKLRKSLIKSVYVRSLVKGNVSYKDLAEDLNLDVSSIEALVRDLAKLGVLEVNDDSVRLTERGRSEIKVVLTGGVFDIIHPGHIYTLKKAKSLGDLLVVVVARDETVRKFRGSKPLHNEKLRHMLVSSLKFVDIAILGSERDIFETVELVKPDVIALGYDQKHDENAILREGRLRGLEFNVVRLDSPYPHIKSSDIKSKLKLSG